MKAKLIAVMVGLSGFVSAGESKIVVEPELPVLGDTMYIEALAGYSFDSPASSFGGGVEFGVFLSDSFAVEAGYEYIELNRANHQFSVGGVFFPNVSLLGLEPFVSLGGAYQTLVDEYGAYSGVGVSLPISNQISAFTEGRYLYLFDSKEDEVSVRLGIRIKF